AFAGAVDARLQVLLDHRRHRWAARAVLEADLAGRPHRFPGRRRIREVHQLLLLLRAGRVLRVHSAHVADRPFPVRQDAAGDPRQRDPGALSRRADLALPLAGVPRVGDLHRPGWHSLGAAQRADHPGRPVLAAVRQDRVLRGARGVPQLLGPDRRGGALQLPRGLRYRAHRILADHARRDPDHPGDLPAGGNRRHRATPVGEVQMNLLRTEALKKHFGETRAVDGVNFTVNEGEFLSLVGTNGAGKTTLVNLFDDLSVLDNVALAIFAREGKTKRILALAERDAAVTREASDLLGEFGLDGKSEGRAGGLAQGERKLLDVAVAYALRPRLLFLDEPTSGVSTRDKAQIMDTVSAVVRGGGITAVVIEHDMDVVFKYSDRVVVMHEGRFLADGPPGEIRQNSDVAKYLLGTDV